MEVVRRISEIWLDIRHLNPVEVQVSTQRPVSHHEVFYLK